MPEFASKRYFLYLEAALPMQLVILIKRALNYYPIR